MLTSEDRRSPWAPVAVKPVKPRGDTDGLAMVCGCLEQTEKVIEEEAAEVPWIPRALWNLVDEASRKRGKNRKRQWMGMCHI